MNDIDETIIGKGTWLDKIAYNIIQREKKLERPTDMLYVESGLGASGIPHIGSMGDAVRAYGISLALQNLGYKSELIAFSDDMDGLRKVPKGLPEWLNDYICVPVSSIPDPFGDCHESYGKHMSSLLLEGLDAVGIKYNFKSGTEIYKSGILEDQIHTIFLNSKIIGSKIEDITNQQKYTQALPFFPICEHCNRLYVAEALEYFEHDRVISYVCKGNQIGGKIVEGCGYKGEHKIRTGNGKLAWKVEFAARWKALDIKFEAFGKDIMDSVKINDWIASDILNFPHPYHVKYEMFLDKGGKKISKSAGNVLTPQVWLKYGHPQSLMLLLYKRIAGTRLVGLDDIPLLMDEYDLYEDIYFDKISETNPNKRIKIKGIYEYINILLMKNNNFIHIPHRILLQQAELFIDQSDGDELISKIFDRLIKYNLVSEKDRTDSLLRSKIKLAINWARDFKGVENEDTNLTEQKLEVSQENYKIAFENIKRELIELAEPTIQSNIYNNKENDSATAETTQMDLNQRVQTIIFENAKKNQIPPRELFKLFYKILINAEKGPRLGNYMVDLGLKNVVEIIERKIK